MHQSRPSKSLPEFDKYYYYSAAVQSPTEDARFFDEVYRKVRGAKAKALVLREDFCGTFANCCEWVKLDPKRRAHGVDLDPEPLAYGRERYLPKLPAAAQARVAIHRQNVLSPSLPHADVICALNFSYYIFKDRPTLKRYLKNCLRTLNERGVLILDSFGGPKCMEANEEVSEHGEPGFDYFWDQDSFDPLTAEAMFYIHFKRKGEKKREKVFAYDWRMWSPPEIKDLLLEVGFQGVDFLWEGSTDEGYGDGDFQIATTGEECEAYVAYIVGRK